MDYTYKEYRDTGIWVNPKGEVWKKYKSKWGSSSNGKTRYKEFDEKASIIHTGYKSRYCAVTKRINGKVLRMYVHRMVGELFIENPEGKKEINHLDNNPDNNCIDNLEWCTRKENAIHHIRGCNKKSYESKPTLWRGIVREDGVEYKSITEASKLNKRSTSSIINSIKQNYRCNGYFFKYKE